MLSNYTNSVIYTGITSNIIRRVYEHKNKVVEGFTGRYNVTKLVYYECFSDPDFAISREKQIKAGSRQKKIDLIIKNNPNFKDLYEDILG